MTTLAKLVVELAANSASFQRDMRSAASVAERNMRRIQAEGRETARGLDMVRKQSAATTAALRGMGGAARGLAGVAAGIVAGFSFERLISTTGRAAIEMERLRRVFDTVGGSAAAGAREFEFVRETASRLGLDLRNTANEYASLAAAAKGTALEGKNSRDIFIAVSEASTVLGLSADRAGLALNAIQQMMSKGKVSAEELRGQLGEQLPGAFQAAARAMGVTTSELDMMLQRGEVLAEDLLPRLARVLHDEYGAAAVEASESATASMNRFTTSVNELAATFGSGFLTEGAGLINEITGYLSDPAVTANVEAWGEALGDAIAFVTEHGKTALSILTAMGGAAAGFVVAGPIGAGIGGAAGLAAGLSLPGTQAEELADALAIARGEYDRLSLAAERFAGTGSAAEQAAVAGAQAAAAEVARLESAYNAAAGAVEKTGEAVRSIFEGPHGGGGGDGEVIGVPAGGTPPRGGGGGGGGGGGRGGGSGGGAISRAIREAERFRREIERLESSLDPVQRATAKYEDSIGDLDKALAKGLISGDRHADLVSRVKLEYDAALNPLSEYIRGIEQETMLLGLSGREREIQVALLEAEAIARRQGLEMTDEWREALVQAKNAELDAADAARELTRSVDPMAQVFEDVASAIHSSWTDLWQGLFDGGIDSMKDMGKQLLDMFKSTIARMAALATAKPILVPVITAVGGAFGLGGDQIGGVLGQLGLGGGGGGAVGGGLPGTGGLGSLFSGGLGGNSIGSTLSGLPGVGGLFGQGAGFSNLAFGGAGLLGGLVGTAIGGTGGGIGGSIGSTLGLAVGGPIGAVLGGLGGSLLGGLFGGKKPSSKLQASQVDLSTGDVVQSGLTGKKFSQENRDAADALTQTALGFTALLKATGGETGKTIGIRVGDRRGLGVNVDGQITNFERENQGEFLDFLRDAIAGSFTGLSADIQAVIDNIDLENLQQAGADLDFAQRFRTLFDPQESVGPFERAMQALEAQFAEAQQTARRLGLDVDALSATFGRGAGAITDEFDQGIRDAILSIQDPAQAAVVALDREFDTLRQEAEAVGGDLVAIEELYGLRRAALVEGTGEAIEQTFSNWQQLAEDLAGFSESLLLGDTSPLTNEQRLGEAQRQFDELARAAGAGDEQAAGQLQGAASTLLDEGKAFFAQSSPQFAELFGSVRGTLDTLAGRFTGFASEGAPEFVPEPPVAQTFQAPAANPPRIAQDFQAPAANPPVLVAQPDTELEARLAATRASVAGAGFVAPRDSVSREGVEAIVAAIRDLHGTEMQALDVQQREADIQEDRRREDSDAVRQRASHGRISFQLINSGVLA